MTSQYVFRRGFAWSIAACVSVAALAAQGGAKPTPVPAASPVPGRGAGAAQSEAAQIQAVRVAIGRGQLDEARRLAGASIFSKAKTKTRGRN
jgi:hypothetical protein